MTSDRNINTFCQIECGAGRIDFRTSIQLVNTIHPPLLTGFVSPLTPSSVVPHPDPQVSGSTCSPQGITTARAQQVTRAFTNAKLVPQAVPAFPPKVEIIVAYGSKRATWGTVYSALKTRTEPTISFSAEPDQDPATNEEVIFFVDPDTPGPTSSGGGRTLTPLSTPHHRYTQFVYRQPPGYTLPLELAYLAGGLFNPHASVNQGGLTLAGGSYFLQGLGSIAAIGKSSALGNFWRCGVCTPVYKLLP